MSKSRKRQFKSSQNHNMTAPARRKPSSFGCAQDFACGIRRPQNGSTFRIMLILLAFAIAIIPSSLVAQAQTTTKTLRFTAAKDRSIVTLTITAGNQSITVEFATTRVTTATVKRDELKTRLQIQRNLKRYNWVFDNNGTDGLDVTVPGNKMTVTFKPDKSGESKDVIKGKGNAAAAAPPGIIFPTVGTISFTNTVFDALDADGLVSEFLAGVTLSDVEYLATVDADDPELGGDLSGGNIAQVLFNRLVDIAPADQVSLQFQPTNNLILAQFVNPYDGIAFGNTSSTDGVEGFLSEPPDQPGLLGNMVVTGHDDDFHMFVNEGTDAQDQLLAMANFARSNAPNPNLKVLVFDHGFELTTDLNQLGIPFDVVDPDAGVPDAGLFDVNTYSAIAVASDESCGGCDNTAVSSANLALAGGPIADFVAAGGGILAFAGANSPDYYAFLPVTVIPTGEPGDTGYTQTDFGASIGIGAVNGNPTHNLFDLCSSDPQWQTVELWLEISPETAAIIGGNGQPHTGITPTAGHAVVPRR